MELREFYRKVYTCRIVMTALPIAKAVITLSGSNGEIFNAKELRFMTQ